MLIYHPWWEADFLHSLLEWSICTSTLLELVGFQSRTLTLLTSVALVFCNLLPFFLATTSEVSFDFFILPWAFYKYLLHCSISSEQAKNIWKVYRRSKFTAGYLCITSGHGKYESGLLLAATHKALVLPAVFDRNRSLFFFCSPFCCVA